MQEQKEKLFLRTIRTLKKWNLASPTMQAFDFFNVPTFHFFPTTMRPTDNVQPYPLRGCYLDGANVQVKTDDPFLLQSLAGKRSFNFCPYHLNILLQHAPLEVIDDYRRRILIQELTEKTYNGRYSLKKIIADLDWMMARLMD